MHHMNVPPLASEIVTLINELYPSVNWTNSMRTEWRQRLGTHKTEAVLKAIRDCYAEDGRYPHLSKVLTKLKAGKADFYKSMDVEQLKAEIFREVQEAKSRLRDLEPDQKRLLVAAYQAKIGTKLPSDLAEWKNNQVLMASAIAEIEGLYGKT